MVRINIYEVMIVEIRPYTKMDASEVNVLWSEVFPEETSFKDPDHELQNNIHTQRNLFLVARTETALAGVIIGSFDGDHGWMHYLAVWPQFRRLGVASKLTHALEAELLHLGCNKIRLQVNSNHHDIIKFYQGNDYLLAKTVTLEKKLSL